MNDDKISCEKKVHIHVLIKTVAIFTLSGFILFNLLFASATISANPTLDEYQGPVFCALCHEEEYELWNHTAHANSFNDPIFQEQWKSQGSPDVCLTCHTTGFEMETGNFTFALVGCDMCHGPAGEMNINTSAEFCSSCHSYSHFPTYEEWLNSEHGHANVECVVCHDPMSLDLVADDPEKLCHQCHSDIVEETGSGDHGAEDLSCADCHMKVSLADFESEDVSIMGHTFIPAVPDPDCESCHEVILEAHDVWGANSENCLTCHDAVYMTMLHLYNGTDVALSESSVLCKQCHNDIYYEWEMGIHADPHMKDKECTDCHSPMHPYIMMNATLPPLPQSTDQMVVVSPIPPIFFFGALLVVSSFGIYSILGNRKGGS